MPEQQAPAAEAGDLTATHQADGGQAPQVTQVERVAVLTAVEKPDSRKAFALSVVGAAVGRFIVEVVMKGWERLV
ncbi:hypothetical protein [Nocardia salmonicida]